MKTLKILLIFLLIIPFTSYNKDDDKLVGEETSPNSGPLEIRLLYDNGDIKVVKFTYTDFNKIARFEFIEGSEREITELTYNVQNKLETITETQSDGTIYQATFLYSTNGNIIGLQDDQGTTTITNTSTGFIVGGGLLASGEYIFNNAGQVIKYISTNSTTINYSIDTSIKGPFYERQINPILAPVLIFYSPVFTVQGVNSISNFIFYKNTQITNTANDNGVLTSAFVKFEADDPNSPTLKITYVY